jgi:hypothetical protein
MENTFNKEKLINDLEKVVTVINELIESGIEVIFEAKDDIWNFLKLMIEKLFSFFESFFTRKEIIDLLDFKEDDLFV